MGSITYLPDRPNGLKQRTAPSRRIRGTASDKTVGSFRRPGGLRESRREDQAGNVTVSWYASPMSWMRQFMAPIAMVEAFVDPRTGRPLLR